MREKEYVVSALFGKMSIGSYSLDIMHVFLSFPCWALESTIEVKLPSFLGY